jgi:hypothetical protein
MAEAVNYDIYSQMQSGNPMKTYRKTTLGQVAVTVLNSFSGFPEIVLLKGEGIQDSSIIKLWNDKEVAFFTKSNARALETGKLIEYKTPEETPALVMEPYADATDEKIDEILDTKKTQWYTLTKIVKEIVSEAVIIRLLTRARELERSEKVTDLLTERLSQLQGYLPVEEK